MYKLTAIFLWLFVFIVSDTQAQKLHALLVGNLNEPNLGEGVQKNTQVLKAALRQWAQAADLELKLYTLEKADLKATDIHNLIDKAIIAKDDVVFFHYAGHGHRTERGKEKRWPSFTVEGRPISLWDVYSRLVRRDPNLLIALADCCNTPRASSGVMTRKAYFNRPSASSTFKQLWRQAEPLYIIGSASESGKRAYYARSRGGFFSVQLIEQLNSLMHEQQPQDWKPILAKVKHSVYERTQQSGFTQNPQFVMHDKNDIQMVPEEPALDTEPVTPPPRATINAVEHTEQQHIVEKGETLSAISRTYQCAVQDLMSWNNLDSPDNIRVGAILIVSPPKEITVKRGDNLSKLARKYNCQVEQLRKWNKLKNDKIKVGQKLIVRP